MWYMLVDDKPVLADINSPEFQAWFENVENRKIATTIFTDDIRVSTVFLGLDHILSGYGAPILFETMIFGSKLDGYQDRTTTKAQALENHKKAVDLLTKVLEGHND